MADEHDRPVLRIDRAFGCGGVIGERAQRILDRDYMLAASAAWVALRSPRPWREAMSPHAAAELLRAETAQGRFDTTVMDALLASGPAPTPSERYSARPPAVRLSAREIDVLRSISRGASNKEAARELELSPSTVRTHVESVFRKLECSTRAAATLKASGMGFL